MKIYYGFEYIYKNILDTPSHIHNYTLKRCLQTFRPLSPSENQQFLYPNASLLWSFQNLFKFNPL